MLVILVTLELQPLSHFAITATFAFWHDGGRFTFWHYGVSLRFGITTDSIAEVSDATSLLQLVAQVVASHFGLSLV